MCCFRFWIVNCGSSNLPVKSPGVLCPSADSMGGFKRQTTGDSVFKRQTTGDSMGGGFKRQVTAPVERPVTNLGLTGYERFPTSLKLIACLYRPGPQKGRWIIFQWKSGKFCCSFQGGFVVFVVRTSLDGNPVTTLKFHSYPIINPAGLVLLHAFRIWKLSDISISMYISIAEVSIWIMTLCFSPALNSLTPIHSPSLPSIASVQQEFFCLVSMHAIENGAISSARKKSSVSLSTSANGWRPGMKRSPIDELKRQVQGGGGSLTASTCENTFFLVVKLL